MSDFFRAGSAMTERNGPIAYVPKDTTWILPHICRPIELHYLDPSSRGKFPTSWVRYDYAEKWGYSF
jgi:hypothetical protein